MKTKILKLFFAFSLFFSLIILAIWTTSSPFGKRAVKKPLSQAQNRVSGEQPSPLFYKSIGEKPTNKRQTARRPNSAKKKQLFTVEVLVTTKKERATKVVSEMKARGHDAFYSAFNRQGRVFYKVRTGVFASENAASKHLKKVSDKKFRGLKVRKM